MRVLYEARAIRPLPKRVAGPMQEYPMGAYDRISDACHAVFWWRVLRGGLSGLRGEAYVREMRVESADGKVAAHV